MYDFFLINNKNTSVYKISHALSTINIASGDTKIKFYYQIVSN